jgi:hypothetical protein
MHNFVRALALFILCVRPNGSFDRTKSDCRDILAKGTGSMGQERECQHKGEKAKAGEMPIRERDGYDDIGPEISKILQNVQLEEKAYYPSSQKTIRFDPKRNSTII